LVTPQISILLVFIVASGNYLVATGGQSKNNAHIKLLMKMPTQKGEMLYRLMYLSTSGHVPTWVETSYRPN
jgi:hypothetical protein